MFSTGIELINNICKKLSVDDKPCTDTQILILLRSLDKYELNQLITFGTVDKWERQFLNKTS
jgi:hypothetical protein